VKLIQLRTIVVSMRFIKQRLRTGVRTQCFIKLNIFWRTQNLASGRTHIFSNDPTHSFINETPGLLIPAEMRK
jgi:hypothetical protein